MPVQTVRHEEVFGAAAFNPRRIDVVGCGAVGSRIVMSLAKLGIETIHVWDFDMVADHNIANQLFGNSDVGALKTDALAALVLSATGLSITKHEKCEGGEFGSVVFMCVDSMATRKSLWEGSIRYNPTVDVMIESRMGADSGRVYTMLPCNMVSVEPYEKTLYGDDEAEVSACGSSISVGPTAELVSGFAVWQFIRWWRNSQKMTETDVEPEGELIFATRSPFIMGRSLA